MARRTKQEAAATRDHILDTAELVFEERGVSGATLHDIAQAAGLTRGAIYWHFKGKADLFSAMMDRVRLPLEQSLQRRDGAAPAEPLRRIRDSLVVSLRTVANDAQARRVFGIAMQKVEYAGERDALRARHVAARNACLADLERDLRLARRRGQIGPRMTTRAAAIGVHALVDGLIQNWMLAPGGFDLVKVGLQALDAYLAGLAALAPGRVT